MFVIGTAGHIDHGKSTLVKALTGIDPDRLREEKERGMTIDLGFAWLRLPSGREVSVVDVPGHERFIKNMLAGVGGIDLALLVIAADEGIMPQTEEHLAILEILRVKRAVVALTKKDLVEEDWLALVTADVEERLGRSTFQGVPIVAVSATTGSGLPELMAALDQALDDTPPKPNRERPRVPIDRVFTIAGFGTVVTGTLIDGTIGIGQELEIQPAGIKTRARGIQTHKQKVDRAGPGSRVAINLANVAVEEVDRGQVLTTPGWLRPTTAVDARIRTLPAAPRLPHNAQVSFHTGSTEVAARVRLLDANTIDPGETGWAQIQTAMPIAVSKGDLFVLRSPNETLGGGEVVDSYPRRHRRRSSDVLGKLETLERGDPDDLVIQSVEGRFGSDLDGIVEKSGLRSDDVKSSVQRLIESGRLLRLGDRYLAATSVATLGAQVNGELDAYHRRYPLRPGLPREELKSRLRLSGRDSAALFDHLAASNQIVLDDSVVRLPSHVVTFTPEQDVHVSQFMAELSAQPFGPPALDELVARHDLDEEVIAVLLARGQIVRLTESIAFTGDALAEIRSRVVERIQTNGSLNVAELRDMLNTTRKYALAILELFDQQRVTRRVGDARVLR